MKKGELWKLHENADAYTRFSHFVRIEIGVSSANQLKYGRIARAFSRDELKGTTLRSAHLLANVKSKRERNKWLRKASWAVDTAVRSMSSSELHYPLTVKAGAKRSVAVDIEEALQSNYSLVTFEVSKAGVYVVRGKKGRSVRTATGTTVKEAIRELLGTKKIRVLRSA